MKKGWTLFKILGTTLSLLLSTNLLLAQSSSIKGQLQDAEKSAVEFANVALYNSADSSFAKAGLSNEKGIFTLPNLKAGQYYVEATYIGVGKVQKRDILLTDNQDLDLGIISFGTAAIDLATATVTASRVMVEIKPDRTVFNVEGTINSTGDDAMSLMRKAPGVTVDNNDNINVLGRSGVRVFVDGKPLPISGGDLSSYLKNIPSDLIDRIDIITNPGAKYEAEGNAGIIDIRLKKNKNHGANGTVRGTFTQGRYARGNGNITGNYRNKKFNMFGSFGASDGNNFNRIQFDNFQNGLLLEEMNYSRRNWQNINYRFGTDYFINEKHTIGFLVRGMDTKGESNTLNQISIAEQNASIDSILIANSLTNDDNVNNSYNINYQFDDRKSGRSLNIDLDYGSYSNVSNRYQPNVYYNPEQTAILSTINNWFETPSDIDIYTGKIDYEDKLWGGKLGIGTKFSKVVSDNTFLFFDEINTLQTQNDTLSNIFKYDETVYAGYVNFVRQIDKKWGISAGLRAELTDATGDLKAFLPELVEPPVEQNYWRFFPSVGITWQQAPKSTWALNYGRRINRPDYNVLNPFNNRLSQISSQKGNPRLQPEIVNNIELGYTYAYRYNFKLAYSKTTDQITRLIGPDEADPRANFISWENLAEQTVISFNASIPAQITKKWSAYFNLGSAYLDNQADYGDGAVVDVQAYTYNLYTQQTFDLPYGFKGEVSGWFSGPGVWGGVFLYETSWSLNFGLQRKFLDDKMNVRLTTNDVFYESGWNGYSVFDGLRAEGNGNWDSKFISLSIGYNFGNQNVKSRKRKTGLEDEAGRVGDGN